MAFMRISNRRFINTSQSPSRMKPSTSFSQGNIAAKSPSQMTRSVRRLGLSALISGALTLSAVGAMTAYTRNLGGCDYLAQVCFCNPREKEQKRYSLDEYVGACRQGYMECKQRAPVREVCNGQDNDCNGEVDPLIDEYLASAQCYGSQETYHYAPLSHDCIDSDCDSLDDSSAYVLDLAGSMTPALDSFVSSFNEPQLKVEYVKMPYCFE